MELMPEELMAADERVCSRPEVGTEQFALLGVVVADNATATRVFG
jgi:hypothetical protein